MEDLSNATLSELSNTELDGWVYHKAHFGTVSGCESGSSQSGGQTVDLAMDWVFSVDQGLILLIPLLVVGFVGYKLVERNAVSSFQEALKNGASVALGYGTMGVVLHMWVIEAFDFTSQQNPNPIIEEVVIQPELGPMAFLGFSYIP